MFGASLVAFLITVWVSRVKERKIGRTLLYLATAAAFVCLGVSISRGMIIQSAVLLSLPLIATLLVTNSALGVLSRAAPQLNVFAIGFPITILVGFVVLLLTLPYWVPALERLFDMGLQAMSRIAGAVPR